MKLDTKAKIALIVEIGKAGMDIGKKASEFDQFGTFVVNANKAKKKKLDTILAPFGDSLKVSEFDDNMWRITEASVVLGVIQSGRESQWES